MTASPVTRGSQVSNGGWFKSSISGLSEVYRAPGQSALHSFACTRPELPWVCRRPQALRDWVMSKTKKYSPEVRVRAVRMVFEHEREYPSQWAAIESTAEKIGCSGETLRNWVRQAERDAGRRPGPTTAELVRIKELEREVRELRRANEILRKAAAFFARAEQGCGRK